MKWILIFLIIFSSGVVLSKEKCDFGFCTIVKADANLKWVVQNPLVKKSLNEMDEIEDYLRISKEIVSNTKMLVKNIKYAKDKLLLSNSYCKFFILKIDGCKSLNDIKYAPLGDSAAFQEKLIQLRQRLELISVYLDHRADLEMMKISRHRHERNTGVVFSSNSLEFQ